MVLSNDLINEFVEITNDQAENKQETTMYGTIKLHNGQRYVQIDGSELLTPVKATVDAIPGDRVTVLIKDHSVIVNGSTSSPAARKSSLDAVNDHVTALDESGRIVNSKIGIIESNITSINSEINTIDSSIETMQSDISTINSEMSTIDSQVETIKSNITTIGSTVLTQGSTITNIQSTVNNQGSTINNIQSTVNTQNSQIGIINSVFTIEDGQITGIQGIDADFANFHSANIDDATIKKLFADSGVIQEVVTEDSKVTGTLVGVTIIGDDIQGGTVKADKLVILGDDGLYYKLNANAETVTAQQTDYNSLNGSIITAKSITADKVQVSDLVAFAATIGNFHILSDAIYSGSKSTIDNTTQGIYMGSDGQMCIGDGTNYIKYYKDSNGEYKLDISAESLSYKGLNDIQNKIGRINVGTDNNGRPYIELGADNSDFKLRITNETIEFMEGSTTPAWISDQKLYIEQAEIKEEFKFGNFIWTLHGSNSSQNLGLIWKGGN